MTPEAERFNGWAAMLGFIAAVGAYVTTGQIIPGWFQVLMTKVTESGGRQNIYSVEPSPKLDENYVGYPEDAEKVNGRWAMLGFIALIGAYISTGQIIPGIF